MDGNRTATRKLDGDGTERNPSGFRRHSGEPLQNMDRDGSNPAAFDALDDCSNAGVFGNCLARAAEQRSPQLSRENAIRFGGLLRIQNDAHRRSGLNYAFSGKAARCPGQNHNRM